MKKSYFMNSVFNSLLKANEKKANKKSPSEKRLSLFAFLLFLFSITQLTAQTQVNFTASGTWTCPAGVTSIKVEAYGAGGGGGRGYSANKEGGGGGGGGAYTVNNSVPVTPGNTYNIVIGAGGIGGSGLSPGTNGADGGNTSFGGATVVANGGKGGKNFPNGATGGAGGIGGTFNGGNGGDGTSSTSGGGGGCAGPNNTQTNGVGTAAGTGGGGMAGNGGAGTGAGSTAGSPGAIYGGGGGASTKANNNGIAGANGYLRIEYITNDNCSGAIALTVNPTATCTTTTTGTTVTATQSQAITCGAAGGSDDDVWYSFTATGTTHTVTATPGTMTNITLEVFSGACAATVTGSIGCADATSGASAETLTLTGLTPGNTYLVRVYSRNNGANQGTFTLCVTTPPTPPSNDDCAGAIALPVNTSCTYATYTNANATASAGAPAPSCSSYSGGDVWFSAVVPASGEITIDTQTGVITDSGIAIYTGTCGTLTQIACDDDSSANGLMSSATVTGLTPGATVYIRFWEYGNDNNGTFGICASTRTLCTTPTAQPTALILTQPTNGTINGSFTAASPAPSNYLVVYNTTGTTPTPVNGTTYTVGGAVTGGTVADIDANTTFSVTGLSGNVTYYFFVFSFNNNSCAGGPLYLTTSPATANATTPVFYCASTSTSSTYYITNFSTTLGATNITNNASGYSATGYGNFSAQTVTQQQLASVNFSVATFNGTYTYGINIWVDWNNDLDFNDAGEKVFASGAYVSSATGSITVPASATVGNHRMRIVANYNSTDPAACGSITSGETEDYTFAVTAATACTTPTAQPTALILTQPSNGTINGSFTAASPAPSNYLVVYNTTGVAPTPVNGTTYTVGGTVGAGNIVADTDNNTTFSVSGLAGATTYYFFIFSNNAVCTGGPLYNTTSPATANTFIPFYYCIANNTSNTTYYISGVTTTGGSTNFSNTGTGFSATGYADYTATYSVSQNAGLGFNITTTHPSSTYGYSVWVDWNNDGDFSDAGENPIITSYLSSPAAIGTVTIPAGTPAGNYRMRIRNAYLSNPAPACGDQAYGETEDYRVVCLGPLPCSGNPTNVTVNVTSLTTATVNWTAAVPAPANGYQYYYATTTTAPLYGTAPTGSTAAGVTTVNLTGLTSGSTYYIWVRSNCGGGLGQGAWVGPITFYVPNCLVGPGTGTSTLGCPNVVTGGLSLSGADPAPITCATGSCTDIEATFLQLGDTSAYTVSSIPYSPPYQYGCLANPVSVNDDDVWSPTINLPFNFCFYGNTYNQCSIGSNGILTFDMSKAGLASGYSFSNSLPSTTGALFANSIYGVYHDIDPRKGGEVGWELITLNSGCRALVASWSNVPMFSNNSLLYTGMMVLYENTNIIEVYIKEKRVDGTWNGGNAIVGIQNATGTAATVAPGRNGLDADWTVLPASGEAWRFTPSGTSITSLKWFEGPTATGPVIGTTPTLNVCPTTTTTYTAEVTYTLCNGTTLKETDQTTVTVSANKTWNGSVGTDWNTAANWTPASVPTATEGVLIPNTVNKPILSGGAAAAACTLTIQSGASLTINPANTITVTNAVSIAAGGDMILENTASLVQINNSANTGTAHIKRTTQPMYRLDYSYWNSPVTAASGFTVGNLTSGTTNIYRYTPTVANGSGTWTQLGAATVMNPTFGVIARAPWYFPDSGAKQTYTVNFTGTPNNGPITMPIAMGTNANIGSTSPSGGSTVVTDADDEWNLIGNPYPSAINIVSFLNNPTNVPVVDGTVYLWTHNTLPTAATPDPFYGNYVYNYTVNDYATVNSLGATTTATTGGTMPTQYIASGQSFFISAETNGNVTFDNSMRVANNNSNFYRPSNQANITEGFQSQRLWLNLSNNNGGFSQILVGYAEGATLNWDRGFDGEALAGNAVKFYSLGADKKLTIQGRPWPFVQEDIVPLGMKATAQGNYTIGIDHFDDSFNNSNIYLEDKALNLIHNLKTAPYSFTSQTGTFDNRFVLRYTENTLSNEDISVIENSVVIYANEKLKVNSTLETIKEVVVYDVLGRLLVNGKKVNSNQFTASTLSPTNSTLIVKVTLENNTVITKKVVY